MTTSHYVRPQPAYMASQVITYKRASTFGATCTYTPESGGPVNLDGLTITSDIRDANNRIYSCTVTVTSPTTFTVFYGDTAGWALGSAYWDIRFTNNGIIFFSDTVILNVINNITVE